ncbi:MAG: pyridoxamine 5'-phosphate oxidase family protein [Bacillota bacterium]|nr:pyridoxamine 5'-phosphate oxidase family protein [Bacillota bacterium]
METWPVRPLRRSRQGLTPAECQTVLERGTSGVLAVLGDGGCPYAVPLNYALDGGRILFHSAPEGHKLDALRRHPEASFCVVDCAEVRPETLSTRYRSVIAFGRVRIIEDADRFREALRLFVLRFVPDTEMALRVAMEESPARLVMLEFLIERMSGKQARELCDGTRMTDTG